MTPQGRVVLVTGGSRGIGLACARAFVAAGDRVYGDEDGIDDLYQSGYPGDPGDRGPDRDRDRDRRS